jgi:hypothetical protein
MRRLLPALLVLALAPIGAWSDDSPGLSEIRAHNQAGDVGRALTAALAATDNRDRATRDGAWFAVGWLRREIGEPSLAAQAFARSRGALAPLATWYEAEQLLAAGHAGAAIDRCDRYRAAWPTGEHAPDCLRITAFARASRGHAAPALAAAAAYDEEHPWGRITETVSLKVAIEQAARDPKAAIPLLQQLAVHHTTPLAGRVAEELLLANGAEIPDDTASLIDRAISLRDTRRTELSWAVYQQVAARAATDPVAKAWVDRQAEPFGWRTRHWTDLLARNEYQYRQNPSPATAWDVFRVAVRGAEKKRAAAVAKDMLAKWPTASEWRWHGEELGRSLVLIGQYAQARDVLDEVGKRGGSLGKRSRLGAGFAALQAGDTAGAIERLTPLADAGEVEALYWRAKAREKLGHPRDAAADRRAVVARDPHGWYALWVREQEPLLARDGGWPAVQPSIADFASFEPAEDAWLHAPGWTLPRADRLAEAPQSVLRMTGEDPPPSYPVDGIVDLAPARALLGEAGTRFQATWPELAEIAALCDLGIYDLSGPMLAAVHQERTDSLRGKGHHPVESRAWSPSPEAWRGLFLLARDHHHTAKTMWGLWNALPPEKSEQAWQIAWPLAHDREVWTQARAADLDPYLVLGLMRQESTYNAIARSRAGARGAMQIMPRTGHLLADLQHDLDFSAGDLEDPGRAVEMGIQYLALLDARFEGVAPLAIASYNAGPFNTSGWLANTGSDMPLDVWVEHIPYKETRDYVKKVTGGWSTYVALYAEDEAGVVLPARPAGDHPDIVDF